MSKVLFVGGIHGVGKSYFCEITSKKYNIPHYSASSLIQQKKKDALSLNKVVNNVESNQNYLIEALLDLRSHPYILLDGHYCLLTGEGQVNKIPESTFLEILPFALIILKDSVSEISSRLLKRDGSEYDLQLLHEFQNQEIEYSRSLKRLLNVPLLELEAPFDITNAYHFIAKSLEI